MANDVLSNRREARRRRILENSENRLQKIIGRNALSDASLREEFPLVSQNGTYLRNIKNGPIQISSSPSTQIHGSCNFQHAASTFDTMESKSHVEQEKYMLNETKIRDKRDNLSTQLEESPHKSNFYIIYLVKLHLVFLAILVKVMLLFSYGFIFGESLMTPLCMVEVTDILLLKMNQQKIKSSPGILGAVLLFSGIPPQKIAIFTNLLQLVTKIGQDSCVYIFTFVTFHAFMDWQQNVSDIS